jgi:hypothetical protein
MELSESEYMDGLRAGRPGFDFSLLHSIQTGCEAHTASSLVGSEGTLSAIKAARVQSWRLISN